MHTTKAHPLGREVLWERDNTVSGILVGGIYMYISQCLHIETESSPFKEEYFLQGMTIIYNQYNRQKLNMQ